MNKKTLFSVFYFLLFQNIIYITKQVIGLNMKTIILPVENFLQEL